MGKIFLHFYTYFAMEFLCTLLLCYFNVEMLEFKWNEINPKSIFKSVKYRYDSGSSLPHLKKWGHEGKNLYENGKS